MCLCLRRLSLPRPRSWSSSPKPMSTPCPMSRPTSSSAGAGGGARGKGVGIALDTMTAAGSTTVPPPRRSTEGCRPVGGTTTGLTAGRDANGNTNGSRTATWNATGVLGRRPSTGSVTTPGAFEAWRRGPSGRGIVDEWSGDREGPCRCVPGSRLLAAAKAFNPVGRDLAPEVPQAARTAVPRPPGATTTGADVVADSEPRARRKPSPRLPTRPWLHATGC
jgi:hypothetical protein